MPNKSLPMNKLRTIIRLYTERVGLRAIAELSRTSRNTVKKYVNKWNALSMTYEAFLAKSDAELYSLFCIDKVPESPNPRLEALEAFLPSASKEMARKGMTSHKQWERYRALHPDGYSLTQFRVALRRYERVSNPSMRMEHKAGDKLFVDYTGSKLWIYPPGEQPREVEVFVAILGCSLLTYVKLWRASARRILSPPARMHSITMAAFPALSFLTTLRAPSRKPAVTKRF